MLNQRFELEKAVQALNYIIRHLGLIHMNKLDVLKLIFLADRYHLRKYGRMITNDEYWAMTYGPVASSVKDVVELGDFLSPQEKKYAGRYLDKYNKHQLKSISDVDYNVLSESDIEALDAAIEQNRTHRDLVRFTHAFPEWKKHSSSINALNSRVKMDVLDFFSQTDDEIEYCKTPQDILELNREHYRDSVAFSQAWG